MSSLCSKTLRLQAAVLFIQAGGEGLPAGCLNLTPLEESQVVRAWQFCLGLDEWSAPDKLKRACREVLQDGELIAHLARPADQLARWWAAEGAAGGWQAFDSAQHVDADVWGRAVLQRVLSAIDAMGREVAKTRALCA